MHNQLPPWPIVAIILLIVAGIGAVNLIFPEHVVAWQIRRLQRPWAKVEFRAVGTVLIFLALLFWYLFASNRLH